MAVAAGREFQQLGEKIQTTPAMLYVLSLAINRNGFNFGVSLIEISAP